MFRSEANTLSTTRERIINPTESTSNSPQTWVIHNEDASIVVYIGGDDVTAANGMPIDAGGYLTVSTTTREEIWAVAASGAPEIRILGNHR